jgi:hypothetical protein
MANAPPPGAPNKSLTGLTEASAPELNALSGRRLSTNDASVPLEAGEVLARPQRQREREALPAQRVAARHVRLEGDAGSRQQSMWVAKLEHGHPSFAATSMMHGVPVVVPDTLLALVMLEPST